MITKEAKDAGKINTVDPKDYDLSKETFVYNKKVQKPSITVKDADGEIISVN